MKYRVVISETAGEQIEEAYVWLSGQTIHADAWHNGLMKAIASLEDHPLRCPNVPESEDSTGAARQLLFGSKRHAYRIIYDVNEDEVEILQVVHGARARRKFR